MQRIYKVESYNEDALPAAKYAAGRAFILGGKSEKSFCRHWIFIFYIFAGPC